MKEVELKDVKTKAAIRVPPGDRWVCVLDDIKSDFVFDSLTELLEYIFQANGDIRFYIHAREGCVYTVHDVEVEPPKVIEKRYSLYGEA